MVLEFQQVSNESQGQNGDRLLFEGSCKCCTGRGKGGNMGGHLLVCRQRRIVGMNIIFFTKLEKIGNQMVEKGKE